MENAQLHSEDRLSAFIRANLEPILREWEHFAGGILSARHMSAAGLRDHAGGMLLAIADDLEHTESAQEQHAKSLGQAPPSGLDSQAALHGAARVASGFTFEDTLSEFRALRASVLRLWAQSRQLPEPSRPDDTIRFNEAIDAALTESLQRYAAERELSARRFDTLLSSSPDLQCILQPDGTFIYLNDTLAQLFKTGRGAAVGKTVAALCPALADSVLADLGRAVAARAPIRGELLCTSGPDGAVTYRYVLVPVLGPSGEVESITISARNISELKATEAQVLRHAYYDSLTGLPNRMLFRDRLEQEVRHAGRTGRMVGLLYIDLDGFKEVNDRYGHDAGDLVLREAARRIASKVRVSDTVARLGGDEFTVILTEVGKVTSVDALAHGIVVQLARPFHIDGKVMAISCSIGITLFPQDAAGPDEMIRNADQAMFAAKKEGRNRASYFTSAMRDMALARLRVIDELRQAVAQGQLAVYYQPIVELPGGAIVKAEALVRWRHPSSGLILPEHFIGLAEEIGLISEIDTWVLGQALDWARQWSALLGRQFQVSVNQSPLEFMTRPTPAASAREKALLAGARGHVTVEITEGVMLNDSPKVRARLRAMKQAGVQLALDDFGIGYSSMAYLKKFDVDFLKIDQSFVHDMMESQESRIFAETIIIMAHKLGLKVIAEGVETTGQRDWLCSVGCDYAQGFLYAEAQEPERFGHMLARQ